ncbi:hypothetical protein ACFXTH_041632 [Malus domestica]
MKPVSSLVFGPASPTRRCCGAPQLKRKFSSWNTSGELSPFWVRTRPNSSEDMIGSRKNPTLGNWASFGDRKLGEIKKLLEGLGN